MYSDLTTLTNLPVLLKVLSSTSKWFLQETSREYLRLVQYLELKIQIQTDTCVNSQDWTWKWSLITTTLRFWICLLIC